MARRRRNRLRVKIEENVTVALREVGRELNGPQVARILHDAVAPIVPLAQAKAPADTGSLRQGIYVASAVENGFRPLVRSRTGARLNVPLRNPPRGKQALAVSSVFYGLFIEGGRTSRARDMARANKQKRSGVAALRKRPFFAPAVRAVRKNAETMVDRRLAGLITEAWER